MAITEIKEKLDGATAKLNQQRQANYSRVFQVICDDPRTRPGTALLAVGFEIGQEYKVIDPNDGVTVLESDDGAFVTSISCQLASAADDGCQWDVSVEYGPGGGESAVFPANPVEHPIKISWGFAKHEVPVETDIDDKPIVNSAGDFFDPAPTRDDSRPVLKIVRNELTYDPLLALDWKDRINEDSWYGFEPGTVKAGEFPGELRFNAECGFYYEVSYEFEIQPDGWVKKLLDQGMRTLNATSGKLANVLDEKGHQVSSPVLLDGSGQKLASGADPVILEFNIYKTARFADLNFDFASAPGQGGA